MSNEDGNVFILSWDNTGLESCVNISEFEKEIMWDTLQNKSNSTVRRLVDRMLMRARINSQQHYEIYTIHVAENVSKDDLVKMFDQDPKYATNLIRKHGTMIFQQKEPKWNM